MSSISSSSNHNLSPFIISALTTPDQIRHHTSQLTDLLQSCVDDPLGSSLGFLSPLPESEASSYWNDSVAPQVESHPTKLYLFILTSASTSASESQSSSSPILGSILLHPIPKSTHSHRAEIHKLMVAPDARRQGIARLLMAHVEDFARDLGRTLLTLDTATDTPARAFYSKLGWEEWGTCRGYARWSGAGGKEGRCDATFFRKEL